MLKECNSDPIDLSQYSVVFCDSSQALEWAYQNGLSRTTLIKTSSPAILWNKNKNIVNVEDRWTVAELKEFQSTIQSLTEEVFRIVSNITGVERELALTISQSILYFHDIVYKAACLEESDFIESRIFIDTNGKSGPLGKIMNSPWDKLLASNQSFSVVRYILRNDKWKVLTTKGVSYWKRLRVAGYETIIYRLTLKITKKLPSWLYSKEVLMPNENELNIEIASSLALRGVKIIKIQLSSLSDKDKIDLNCNSHEIYKMILPIMREKIEQWVVPSATEVVVGLFESYIRNRIEEFSLLAGGWNNVVKKSNTIKQSVLVNAPGNIKGHALAYVCRKNNITLMSSQHGVTVEISKDHNMYHTRLDNSVSDVMFAYNSKIVEIEKNTIFNNAKHYVIGMPMRLIRMNRIKDRNKLAPSIVYISTNLYQMGLSISSKTDYGRARDEQSLIIEVFGKLPCMVRYKTYPEDNRRYADVDPVLNDVKNTHNMELFSEKIDMRYLISEHSILVTACATSTLGWVVMSNKPVIFINQKNKSPLTDDAYISVSRGVFVFDDDDRNFHKKLRSFLSQPLDTIINLWEEKKISRKEMIKNYFSEYKGGAGGRAAKIILKEYLN